MPSTKHFSFDDLGDVQVMLGHDEELLPEIRFHFDVEGIGNASIAIGFDADHEDTAVTMFDRLDKEAVQQNPARTLARFRAGRKAGSALALLGVDLRLASSIMYKRTVLCDAMPC